MKYKRKKDKDFWQLARSYLHDYMPVTRNLSDKSVEAYKQSLKTYLQFLEIKKSLVEEQVTFEAFSRENIKDFIGWLKEKGYAQKTINLKLTAIRSFLKYCSDEDFELRGIYADVYSKKAKRRKTPH
jgi:site-specific recombinase XerD